MTSNEEWKQLDPTSAKQLADARRQLHHAAQLATAFGISYLPRERDDSHTNLEWLETRGALASNEARGSRVAVRVRDLTLTLDADSMPLRGATLRNAADWLRARLGDAGFDRDRFTIERHYEIPGHPVEQGAPFDAREADLEQLSRWYSNAATLLESLRGRYTDASKVRCWPHHFDIAMLITLPEGRSVGVGLEPGDVYYDEPYFYVNMQPSPVASTLPPTLDGKGTWHTREWIGAVLPGSRLETEGQEHQARAFVESAIGTAIRLLTLR